MCTVQMIFLMIIQFCYASVYLYFTHMLHPVLPNEDNEVSEPVSKSFKIIHQFLLIPLTVFTRDTIIVYIN